MQFSSLIKTGSWKWRVFLLSLIAVVTLVTLPHAASAQGTIVFSDDFTDVNGTPLSSHNSAWHVAAGSAEIQNNTLNISPSSVFVADVQNYTLHDACVSVDAQFPLTSLLDLNLRSSGQDLKNTYYTFINPEDYTHKIAWYDVTDSQQYIGGVDNVNPPAGWHNFKMCVIGSTITTYLDNNQLATVNDTHITDPGIARLVSYNGNVVDNFVLESFDANGVPPTVGTITASPNPVTVNTNVTASANFTDADTADTHTATADWGDGSNPQSCTVSESNGSGSVSCTHQYASANVYPVTITVSDGSLSGTSPVAYISVYNPTQQSIFTAASKYTSPAGAYTQDLGLTGTVLFGLSYKYQGTVPVGNRQFSMDFNAANLHFNATSISSLVIANGIGTLQGTGTLNGTGGYSFLVTGSESAKTIRIQIKNSIGATVYDTQPGAADTATPTTSVTGNVLAH